MLHKGEEAGAKKDLTFSLIQCTIKYIFAYLYCKKENNYEKSR